MHIDETVRHDERTGPDLSSQEWNFDLHSGNDEPLPPAFYQLAGSSYYYEMTMADPAIYVRYDLVEVDPILDDVFFWDSLKLHPSTGSYDGSEIYTQFSGDCRVEFDADVTVTLLTPPPPPIPVGVPHVPPPSPPPTSPPTPPTCQGNPQNCQEP